MTYWSWPIVTATARPARLTKDGPGPGERSPWPEDAEPHSVPLLVAIGVTAPATTLRFAARCAVAGASRTPRG